VDSFENWPFKTVLGPLITPFGVNLAILGWLPPFERQAVSAKKESLLEYQA
jgi:hypothetical protein